MAVPKSASLSAKDFVHLHNHTHHSVLDGLQKVPQMVERVKERGMDSVAITDHGTLSGAIEFYKAAKNHQINPIIGMETYVASRSHTDKDPAKDKSRFHLIILAMNNIGYENLMRLSTTANLDGFYHKPRIDHQLLEKYNEGLIVLSGCIGGEVGENLRYDQDAAAEEVALWYKSVFGDRYYLELQDHGHMWEEQAKLNRKLLGLARKLDIKPVVTADAHYLTHEDQEAHEVLLCIQTGAFLSEPDRMSLTSTDLYVTDPQDIIERWQHEPDTITNTAQIASRCSVDIKLGDILIPKFPLPDTTQTEEEYLKILVYNGLVERYVKAPNSKQLSIDACKKLLPNEVLERAAYELETIMKMGFPGYFLIVQDFINWGKAQGIVFGPGRGSAAGSIVAYSLRITDLDPLEYDLLFERFLNPDRISMPDIDIDIQDSRRDEVIQYCVEKYGQDRVANIVTFGTMAARNAIRDVARVLEVPYAESDRLAKMVPPPVQGRHIPLAVSLEKNNELKYEYENNPIAKQVFDLAIKLEGTIRSHGVHAAGVVIAPDELVKFTPLEMSQKGVVATQYPMGPVEELGLLKMDFLGLSNLTIVKNAIRIIRKVNNETIDLEGLSLKDTRTYELLGKGETTGVFQFESGGMKRYLKQLKPQVFEDIVAMGALYRPGPLTAGLTDKFIARKNGSEKVEYAHEMMRTALEPTYGVLVYQEQVMRIAVDMCGLSGGEADTLRKAIGKKNLQLMEKMKVGFIDGMISNAGVTKKFAEEFWKELEGFADYAFNKSHSACYGMISYWTAYLKANYPAPFMAALMTSDYDDTDRLAIEISECRHMGIEVLPPDVNESYLEFGVVPDKDQIRFGMAAVKNVGTGAVEAILVAREEGGKFKSIEDFVERVSTRVVNRKAWESLIKAGAFDDFGDRSRLLFNLDTILAYGQKQQKEQESGQSNLFGDTIDVSVEAKLELESSGPEMNEKEALQWERELLGIYLSKHPLDQFDTYLSENAVELASLTTNMDNKKVTVGGVISTLREITTKNGAKMAFVGIEDKTGEVELIVFPNAYSENPEIWVRDNVIVAKGKINTKDRDGRDTEEIKVLVDEAVQITEVELKGFEPTGKKRKAPKERPASKPKDSPEAALPKLYLHIKKPDNEESLLALKKILNQFPGDKEAILVFGDSQKSAIRLPFKVELNDDLTQQIAELLTPECVAIK